MFWLLISAMLIPAAAAGTEFSRTVYGALEEAGCRSCHGPDGVASPTRLHFPEPGATPGRIEAFGKSLVALVDRENPASSLLVTKPTNRVPHAGGRRIAPGSEADQALRAWASRLARLPESERIQALRYERDGARDQERHAGPVLRRMTHAQYNNTVRDLLGELGQPASQFPPEDFVNGFKNQYGAQSLSPMLFEAYSAGAERLARNAFRRGAIRRLIRCDPSPECGAEFIRSIGLRMFRRPLSPAEQRRYAALLEGDFFEGARSVIEAMLQSPHFLFYLDETPDAALKPYAAASRLSYMIWNSTPDEALLDSAASGALNSPEGLTRAARRLLDDPRAKEALGEFVSQWLRFESVLAAGRDRRLYPDFSRETALAMTEEARRLVDGLVWQDRNFMEVFTADYGYINTELARVYGLPAPAGEFERVTFPPESERAGLLGQGLVLTLTSTPNETSPTARGLFVREQFLCQHVPDPPPGVSTDLPPPSEAKPQTNRQRLGVHAADQACASCHSLIDPIGFGLEKFDAVGARRERQKLVFYPLDRKSKEPPRIVELDLDTKGQIAGVPDSDFSSPRELGEVLARTAQCQECVVKQYFRYVAGRTEEAGDRQTIRQVFEEFRRSGFRFREMMVTLALAREFPTAREGGDVSRRRTE
ncbi:MAG: DUF1592 domain-containing protein [Bryobacterales bacterium]|nr:DUF1592 domain-containing protein [Bryobacterales bacterium]